KTAPLLGVQPIRAHIYTPADIDNARKALAHESIGGLLVLPDTFTTVHRDKIVALANHYRAPAMYPFAFFALAGGLIALGARLGGAVAIRRFVRRSHRAGCASKRSTGSIVDQIRIGHQPQDREGAPPRSASNAARPRR